MFDIIKEQVEAAHTIGLRQGVKLGFFVGVVFGVMAPYFVAAIARVLP